MRYYIRIILIRLSMIQVLKYRLSKAYKYLSLEHSSDVVNSFDGHLAFWKS